MTRRTWATLLLAGLLMTSPAARADDVASGTVGASAGSGTYKVSFPASARVSARDVFTIMRGGQAVGEAMLLLVPQQGMVLVTMQGVIAPGDQVVFARHDSVPVAAPSPTPPPQASAPPSASYSDPGPPPGSAGYSAGYSEGYSAGYGAGTSVWSTSAPFDPFYGGAYTVGTGIYGYHAYPHAEGVYNAWGHPGAAAADANMASVRAASGMRR